MKYYRNAETGEVFAYEDADIEQAAKAATGEDVPEVFHKIAAQIASMEELTGDELEAHLNPAPTAEQLLEQAVAEAHAYLNSTDYVVIKLNEALLLGEDITAMKAEYADVISEREVKRTFIRENS